MKYLIIGDYVYKRVEPVERKIEQIDLDLAVDQPRPGLPTLKTPKDIEEQRAEEVKKPVDPAVDLSPNPFQWDPRAKPKRRRPRPTPQLRDEDEDLLD